MKNSNEKSLKIVKETIFDRIKRFINQILKKNNNEIEIQPQQVSSNLPKEEFIQKMNNTEETADLIRKIETEEIKIEEQKDEELEQINANLTRYLEKITQEIENHKTEEKIVENQIKNYKEQMAKYKERMAN